MAAKVLDLCMNLLKDWFEGKLTKRYIFGDSMIALSWTIYRNTRLLPFHRHQVIEINKFVTDEEKFHFQGQATPPTLEPR